MDDKIHKGYKFRVYPNEEQRTFLAKSFGCNRFIWNYFLNARKDYYLENQNSDEKRGLTYNDTAQMLTNLKKQDQFEWLNEVNSQSLQQTLKQLDSAYISFFKKQTDFPRFKSKKDKQSFLVPQNFKLQDNKLFIPKLKTHIRVIKHRNFSPNTRILSVTISKTPTGKYYASFCVEEDKTPTKKAKKGVGIDVGIKDFATLSDGTKINNPNFNKRKYKKLEYQHKQLSKKKKGSNNRNKARIRLAKTYEKVTNKKQDFSHKLSRQIVDENKVIVVEDLKVSEMLQNRNLSRPIHEVSWGEFLKQLEYKTNWYGRSFIKIDRFFPSSKLCPCGYINQDLDLSQRNWECPSCQRKLDRDLNAANNILNQGLNILNSGEGHPSEDKQKLGEAFGLPKSMNQEASIL